jgi:hypothetical protein
MLTNVAKSSPRQSAAIADRARAFAEGSLYVDALEQAIMTIKILSWNINGLSTIVHYHPWNSSPTPFTVCPLWRSTLLNTLTIIIVSVGVARC